MGSREGKIPFRLSALPFRRALGLQSALHTRVDCIERCRAADVKSVSLLTAEAQVGDSFRYVDLAEQLAFPRVAAHAVLFRITPPDGAPDAPFGVTAHPVGNPGLRHFRNHFPVRHLSAPPTHLHPPLTP